MATMRLVVAMRLQGQHPSFRLRTSTSTPSIPMNVAQRSISRFWDGMRFPSCIFCLKRHLGEPAPFKTRLQFERAHQPVRTHGLASAQGTRSWENLTRIAMCVSGAWHSHVGAKWCYGSKISNNRFIKVMIGLTELMWKGNTVRYLFGKPKEQKDLQFDSKEFKAVPRS
jgi:hypothetical protein